MKAVHQLLPTLSYGDAISNYALILRDSLRARGYASEIFSYTTHPHVARERHPLEALSQGSMDALIYHHSIDCKNTVTAFERTQTQKILLYHNVTPCEFFAPFNGLFYEITKDGRDRLASLKPQVRAVFADSAFNMKELAELGYPEGRVLPIAVDFESFEAVLPDPRILRIFRDEYTNFIFTGRIAPNKKQEDVVRLFAWYNKRFNRASRLILVGGYSQDDVYVSDLREVIRSCEVEDNVVLTGHVSFAELVAYYKVANLFVCMSEHEGFCVPLLEAMHFKLPILAYAAPGVAETLGFAGVISHAKDIPHMARAAHEILTDPKLRAEILRRQEIRLSSFRPGLLQAKLDSALKEIGL